MLIYKSFKYRVYPNKSTITRLDQWNSALKWLWNLANEQRRMGYSRPKGERIYPSSFDQGKELTELRKVAPWIYDVPRHVCVSVLDRLGESWARVFRKISGSPKWKRKSDYVSFTEFDHTRWNMCSSILKFPKLPPMKIVMSRPLEGKPKACTLKRDGDQWFASIVCEIDMPDPLSRAEPRVGIDRGITNFIGDSDRRLVPGPKFLEKELQRLARAQRSVSRKVKGSKNRDKAKNRVMRLHRKIRHQRDHFLHVESSRYAKSHGVVVLEDLNVSGMVRSNLARSIQDVGWSKFATYLNYKLKWSGGTLGLVPAHYTSQTCSQCQHVDSASRVKEKFKCTKCGHEDHADLNAPINILRRWSPSSQPVEGSSQRAPRRSRKVVPKERMTKVVND